MLPNIYMNQNLDIETPIQGRQHRHTAIPLVAGNLGLRGVRPSKVVFAFDE
jgi:hypothetical protein